MEITRGTDERWHPQDGHVLRVFHFMPLFHGTEEAQMIIFVFHTHHTVSPHQINDEAMGGLDAGAVDALPPLVFCTGERLVVILRTWDTLCLPTLEV